MPLFDLFWTMLWFFLFVAWISLLISIFGDIFRSTMSGLGKAVWAIFVIVVPLLGCLVYLLVHGDQMHQRSFEQARRIEEAQRAYIRDAAGSQGTGTADELAKLAQLKEQGVISDAEFAAQKAKLLA